MSNYPFTPYENDSLSPELKAMEKLSKSFRGVFIYIIVTLSIIFSYVFLAVSIPIFDHPDELISIPGAAIIIGIGFLVFVIYSLFIWIRFYYHIWLTPSSIVLYGGFGKTYVILSIVSVIINVLLIIFDDNQIEINIIYVIINGSTIILGVIFYLIYIYRIAIAINSKRIEDCVGGVLSGSFLFIFLLRWAYINKSYVKEVSLVFGFLFLLVSFIAWLNSFNYASKDIMTFIQNQCHKSDNTPETCQQPDQGQ